MLEEIPASARVRQSGEISGGKASGLTLEEEDCLVPNQVAGPVLSGVDEATDQGSPQVASAP